MMKMKNEVNEFHCGENENDEILSDKMGELFDPFRQSRNVFRVISREFNRKFMGLLGKEKSCLRKKEN